MRSLYLSICLLCIQLSGVDALLLAQNSEEQLMRQLSDIAQQSDIAGFGVAIVSDQKVYFSAGFGYADKENQQKYSTRTIHAIGSVSKTLVGVCIMKAVEQGLVDLDEDINSYLPWKIEHPRYPNTAITLRILSQHTSGIIDSDIFWETDYYFLHNPTLDKSKLSKDHKKEFTQTKKNKKWPLNDYLFQLLNTEGSMYSKKNFSLKAPGKEYEYSNTGAGLAALVIEHASGMPFNKYCKKYIIDPLGMHNSGWFKSEVDMSYFATCYLDYGYPMPLYALNTYPDGGFITSIDDIILYLQEIISGYLGKGKLLSPTSYQTLLAPDAVLQEHEDGIFFSFNKRKHIGHNGADPGVFTNMFFNPKTHLGTIFFTNQSIHENKEQILTVRKVFKAIRAYENSLD